MSNKVNGLMKNVAKSLAKTTKELINESIVTIYSQRQITINNYGKILKFDDNILVVGDDSKVLKVLGSKLVLSEMSEHYLVIDGSINSVEFTK